MRLPAVAMASVRVPGHPAMLVGDERGAAATLADHLVALGHRRIGIVTGPIPGPGGIFFAAPGLALVLKTSIWAKRRYVKFKRWQPRVLGKQLEPGSWTDMVLRRRSARR